jgi:ABC-type transport system involved in multi-copper enzyme maturation permease subunit
VSAIPIIAGYALRESLRRRVFAVVLVLTAVFLGLYALGAEKAFDEAQEFAPPLEAALAGIDSQTLTGATVFGLSMFGTLFLGTVLAAFLTLGVVRGDAERGLLQPLVVRPIGRSTLLVARFLAAASVCGLYVLAVYASALAITWATGGWVPDRILGPALQLAAGVAVIAAISLLGSCFLSTTANGIAVFMIFGAGLVAGLLGQIGEVLASQTLTRVAEISSWILPFEALYQDGLNAITADSHGFTEFALELGPFGGAQPAGGFLWPWTAAYVAFVGLGAVLGFVRKDL